MKAILLFSFLIFQSCSMEPERDHQRSQNSGSEDLAGFSATSNFISDEKYQIELKGDMIQSVSFAVDGTDKKGSLQSNPFLVTIDTSDLENGTYKVSLAIDILLLGEVSKLMRYVDFKVERKNRDDQNPPNANEEPGCYITTKGTCTNYPNSTYANYDGRYRDLDKFQTHNNEDLCLSRALSIYTWCGRPQNYGVMAEYTRTQSFVAQGLSVLDGDPPPQVDPPEEDTQNPISLPADIWEVKVWQDKFDQAMVSEHNNIYNSRSLSGDGWHLYNLAYAIDGLYSMFKATKNTKYLDRGLLYVENVISKARPGNTFGSQFSDGYLGWGNRSHPSSEGTKQGYEYALFESYMWRYVTLLLRTMHDTPGILDNADYRARFDNIVRFTETNIFDKWYSRSVSSHIYRSRTHMASHWAMICMNMLYLSKDEDRKLKYKTILDAIDYKGMDNRNYQGASLRGQMKSHPSASGAVVWDMVWDQDSYAGVRIQDVAHGNAVATYIVEAYELGNYWQRNDIDKIVTLVNKVVLTQPSRTPKYIDGSGGGTGWINDGFSKLGRYSVELQRKLQSHRAGGMQFFGAGALNRLYLEGGVK